MMNSISSMKNAFREAGGDNGIHNCHTVLTTVVTNYVFFMRQLVYLVHLQMFLV